MASGPEGWALRMDAPVAQHPVEQVRSDRVLVAATVACSALLLLPVFRRLVVDPSAFVAGTNDFAFHIGFALEHTSFLPPRLPAPHPLFHLSVAAFAPVLGGEWAAVVVACLGVAATALVLVLVGRTPVGSATSGLPLPAACAFALGWIVIESPTVLWQLATGRDGPFAIVHFWGSPTEVLTVPLAILLVLLLGSMADDPGRWEQPEPWFLLGAALVVGAAAKPSVPLVLVPAVLVLCLASPRWRSVDRGRLLARFVLPAALIAAAQTAFLMWGTVPTGDSGFRFAPLEVARAAGMGSGVIFWSFPLLMLVTTPLLCHRLRGDTCLHLSLLATVVALPPMLLLAETGPRAGDAALLKTGFVGATLVSVFWLRALVAELVDGRRPSAERSGRTATRLTLAAVAVLLVVAGVVAYLDAVGAVTIVDVAGNAQ